MKVIKVSKAIDAVTKNTKSIPVDYECAHCGEMNHTSTPSSTLKYLNRQGFDTTDISRYCNHCAGKNVIILTTEILPDE